MALSQADIQQHIDRLQRVVGVPEQPKLMPANWVDDYLHPQSGSVFQFAGARSQSADRVALQAAQQFEKQGHASEAIREKTGWFRGEDERWRYEISDHEASLKADQLLATTRGRQQSFNGPLAQILDHPRLYAAYPDLMSLQVNLAIHPSLASAGSHHPAAIVGDQLSPESIAAHAPDISAIESELTHEIQHAIQDREGFAIGTTPVAVYNIYIESLKEREDELYKRWKTLERMDQPSEAHTHERELIELDLSLINSTFANHNNESYRSAFVTKYLDSAGEREARSTQQSQTLTPQQRAERPPILANESGLKPVVQFNDSPMKEVAAEMNITPKADTTLLPQKRACDWPMSQIAAPSYTKVPTSF